MVKILDANQIPKIDRPFVQPYYLVHLLLTGLTLYWSDRSFTYNGHNYEDYLCGLSDIENEINNLGGGENAKVTLRFKNDKILAKNTLIELFDDYPPEKKYVEIYKLYMDTLSTNLGPNLVTNGEMEDGEPPTGWGALTSPTAFERSGTQKYSGSYSAHVVSQGGYRGFLQNISFVSGKTYKISYWYYLVSGALDVATDVAPWLDTGLSTTGSWQYVEHILTVTTESVLNFFSNNTAAEFYIDDVSVQEILDIPTYFKETFATDVSTKIFKGEMGQPYDIYDPATDFKIDCSLMLFGKNVSLPLDVIDLADYPSADPDDVGKHRNILYGSLKKVICPWTVAGWLSTLTADITAAATSIVVTDSNGCPATPFTTFIENEQVRVTGNTKATGTLAVTRAYGSTTVLAHNKGDEIYEKRTDFEAEVAQHPVKSIGDVFVKKGSDEWLRVLSGATKNINTGGRATIVFSDKVKYEEKTNQVSALATEPHDHTITFAGASIKKCIPSGGTAAVIDGNEVSYYGWGGTGGCTATFTEANLGIIGKQYIWVLLGVGQALTVYVNDSALATTAPVTGWQRFTKIGGNWGDHIDITGVSGGNVCEIYKEVEYTPAPTIGTKTLTPSLSGNSVANMVIGDLVACDVDGYADPDGNYGGIGTLIERPDWIRKHILIILLCFVAGDIGSSFGTVGTIYGSQIAGGYKFAFNLPEVAIETMDLFEKMDLQSRSNMFESGGVFNLAFGATSDPTSRITFDKDNIKGSFTFSKSEVVDIRNKLRGYYFRDYSKSGNLGDQYQKNNEKSNAISITKYGAMQEDIEFSCVGDLSTMVDDVLMWVLIEKQDLKKIVEFEAFWDANILEHCDHFIVTSNFWTGKKFKTIRLSQDLTNEIISIKGTEFSVPFVKYGTGIKFGDGYKYNQLI
jgi:hypothetical protein